MFLAYFARDGSAEQSLLSGEHYSNSLRSFASLSSRIFVYKGHVGGDGWGSANGMRAITRPHQHGFGYIEQVNLFFPVNKLLNE